MIEIKEVIAVNAISITFSDIAPSIFNQIIFLESTTPGGGLAFFFTRVVARLSSKFFFTLPPVDKWPVVK